MQSDQEIRKARLKLAQLWNTQSTIRNNIYLQQQIVQNIVKDGFDVNCKVTIRTEVRRSESYYKECTALHFTYLEDFDISIFNLLLDCGADFTLKNRKGQTVIHLMVSDCYRNLNFAMRSIVRADFPYRKVDQHKSRFLFITSVLLTQIKRQNAANPQDNHGVSHLHGSCITNHVESLKLFLDSGASVDQAVNTDATYCPGFTPLHFAANCNSIDAIQLLMSRGANLQAKDASGRTALDVCVKYRLDALKFLANTPVPDIYRKDLQTMLGHGEQIIKLLIEKKCPYTGHLSNFQLACTFADLTMAESLFHQVVNIDQVVAIESPVCPGYTAAHFAALNSIDAVKMLVRRGAKLDVVGSDGLTPIDICVRNYSLQNVQDFLSCTDDQKGLCLSDGTKLSDLVLSMGEVDRFRLFLQNLIANVNVTNPQTSSLWASSTVLHVAVIVATDDDTTIVEECLVQGLNAHSQNRRGQTALHLAFRLGKEKIVRLLIQHLNGLDIVENHVDEDNLSYLHIACSMKNRDLVEKLLQNSDPNVVYKGKRITNHFLYFESVIESGWTPLHIIVVLDLELIAESLLRHGANLHAADVYGLTPMHWRLTHSHRYSRAPTICKVLFKVFLENPKDCVVEEIGLSYLHVACFAGNTEAIKKLLEFGSNVNAVMNYKNESDASGLVALLPTFLISYSMFTPLHCAVHNVLRERTTVFNLLLRRGIDVLTEFYKFPNSSPCTEIDCHFMSILWEDEDMQKSMETRFGITKLHAACHMKNEEAVRSLLNDGIDINAQIHADSSFFAGYTPLHLLVITDTDSYDCPDSIFLMIGTIVKLLLEHGADVTIANAQKNTPIHLLQNQFKYRNIGKVAKSLLLNGQRDFSINPVNSKGLSHFHLACFYHEVEVVEKFLDYNSIDIDQSIEFFIDTDPGCTPLHMALNHRALLDDGLLKLRQTVDILLKHGANATAEDVHGDTPLHKTPALMAMNIFEKLVSYGADMRKENVRGETPLSQLLSRNKIDYVEILRKYNYKANSWNRHNGEGYIGKLLSSLHVNFAENSEIQKLLQSSDIEAADEMGRTVIHNTVAVSPYLDRSPEKYLYVIESFLKKGIDIDHRDQSGRTALHYAARMKNKPGINALLTYGADINIVDNSGKSAFDYAMVHAKNYFDLVFRKDTIVATSLYLHTLKLQHLRMDVNEYNRDCVVEFQHIHNDTETFYLISLENRIKLSEKFFSQIELTKTLDVGVSSLTLFDLLSNPSVYNRYPYMLTSERDKIFNFCKSVSLDELDELIGIIRSQFQKMKIRLELIGPALSSLRVLLGFSFPGLCEEIAMFLTNDDLKRLIASTKSL